MTCIPIVTGRVCNKKFEENNKICKDCLDYSRCKRKFYENKVKKIKPIKLKGKCPKGIKINMIRR